MIFKKNLFNEEFSRIYLDSKRINSKALLFSKNMYVTEKGLSTRPGMRLSDDPIVFNPWEFSDGYTEFSITNLCIDINRKTAHIAVSSEDDSYSNINYHICAVFSDGSRQNLGCITFTRTDSYTFGVPASYIIYSGKPLTGCGIYFLTRIVYGNMPDDYRIYELSEDMSQWHLMLDSDFYTPTVLMNGHGDSSAKAILDQAVSLSSPRKLESVNMLNGYYHSYYTTDGYSSSFSLPFIPTEQSRIVCRMDNNFDTYTEWSINAGDSISDTVSLEGVELRIRCERSLGRVFFETSGGALYAPAFYGKENNIRFTSDREIASSALKVCSMTRLCTAAASVSEGSGSVMFLSGSSLYPDDFIWADPKYPLYFPESCSLTLSEIGGETDFTVALNGRFLIFRNKNIFSVKISAADRYDLGGIIRGVSNSGKIAYPTVSIDRQMTLPSPVFTDTVKPMGNCILFYCKNGSIYKTDSSLSLTICQDSLFCEPHLSAVMDNKYIIFSDTDCYVYDSKTSDSQCIYHWNFPVRFAASINLEAKTVFFAKNDDGLVYSFTLDGDDDSYLASDQTPVKSQPVESSLTLELITCDRKCRLYSVEVNTDTEKPFEIHLICDGKEPKTEWLYQNKAFIHKPAIFLCLSAEIHFPCRAELRDIGLKYSKLSKI